jgi:AcrR family transcriptional regulator
VPRQRLSVEHRRERLLRAGLQLLGEYDGSPPVGEIARAAGVSKGLLYHYFPDKDDFLVEVVRTAAGEITAATATDPTRPVAEQIEQAIEGYLDYAEAHSPGLRVIFGHRHQSTRVLRVVREQRAARVDRIIEQVVGGWPEQAGTVRASAALRTSLDGALAYLETATLHWLEDAQLTRPAMHTLLTGALHAALELAVRIDPGLCLGRPAPGLDPAEPAPETDPKPDPKPHPEPTGAGTEPDPTSWR